MGRLPACCAACGTCGVRGVRSMHGARGRGQPRRASDALDVQVKRADQARGNLNIALMREVMFLVYPEHVQEFLVIWF